MTFEENVRLAWVQLDRQRYALGGEDEPTEVALAALDAALSEYNVLRGALNEIVETPAEVEMHGDCQYCYSKQIARKALGSES